MQIKACAYPITTESQKESWQDIDWTHYTMVFKPVSCVWLFYLKYNMVEIVDNQRQTFESLETTEWQTFVIPG